jgi:tRNA pseudouridine13 synthase
MEGEPPVKKVKLNETGEGAVPELEEIKDESFEVKMEGEMVSDSDCGIIAFLDPSRPSFDAVMKQRYTDFIVHEIDINGNIVCLTDTTTLPQVDIDEEATKNLPLPSEEEGEKLFVELLGEEQTTSLYEYSKLADKPKQSLKITIPNEDKERRTKFHHLIKKYLPLLNSETTVDGEARTMQVYHIDRKRGHKKWTEWPKTKPNYLQFVLFKENFDSNAALEVLAKALGANSKTFDVSGTKDKRAATSQLVTAYHVTAKRMVKLNGITPGLRVGNYQYVKTPCTLGSHSGNHFTIVLKEISVSEDQVHSACQNVMKNGFINYFGTQRFGTTSVSTQSVGRLLLQGKWVEAIDQILKPRPYDGIPSTNARTVYATTGDVQATLNSCIIFLL